MAGRLRGDRQAEALRRLHGLHDVVDALGDDDGDGPLVDGEVPRGACLIPAGIARDADAAGEAVVEEGERLAQGEGRDVIVLLRLGDRGGDGGGHRGVHGWFLSGCRGRGPGHSHRRRTAAGDPGGSHERTVHLRTEAPPARQ